MTVAVAGWVVVLCFRCFRWDKWWSENGSVGGGEFPIISHCAKGDDAWWMVLNSLSGRRSCRFGAFYCFTALRWSYLQQCFFGFGCRDSSSLLFKWILAIDVEFSQFLCSIEVWWVYSFCVENLNDLANFIHHWLISCIMCYLLIRYLAATTQVLEFLRSADNSPYVWFTHKTLSLFTTLYKVLVTADSSTINDTSLQFTTDADSLHFSSEGWLTYTTHAKPRFAWNVGCTRKIQN